MRVLFHRDLKRPAKARSSLGAPVSLSRRPGHKNAPAQEKTRRVAGATLVVGGLEMAASGRTTPFVLRADRRQVLTNLNSRPQHPGRIAAGEHCRNVAGKTKMQIRFPRKMQTQQLAEDRSRHP